MYLLYLKSWICIEELEICYLIPLIILNNNNELIDRLTRTSMLVENAESAHSRNALKITFLSMNELINY